MPVRNMHAIDSAARFVVGLALIWVGFVDQNLLHNALLGWALGAFGVLNLGSALMRFCPIYAIAGFSTRSRSN